MITFGSLVTKVLQRLALVEGLDAQIYAEPRIQLAIQHKFDMIFTEYWLPEYTTHQEQYSLDGVNGTIVGDLSTKIKGWEDIQCIFYENSHTPLAMAPNNVRDVDIQYPSIRSVATDPKHWFKIIPATTSGKIYITYRTKPADFQEDGDKIYLDTQLLLLGTCWDVLEDDGTNPGASDKFKGLFQDRLNQFNRQQYNIPRSSISAAHSNSGSFTTFVRLPNGGV